MRALGLLMAIGTADLVATAVLFGQDRIEERNPLMAAALAHGPWVFVVVKAATLVLAAVLLIRQDRAVVRRACLAGSGAYGVLLAAAFFGS